MTLRTQILAAFGILLVPLALVALVALSTISRLGGAVDTVLFENERTLDAAARMDVALERLDSAALSLLLGRDDDAEAIAEQARPAFQNALGLAEGNLTVEGEADLVDGIEAAYGEFSGAYDRLADAEPDAARAIYADELVPAFTSTRASLEALRDANRTAASAAAVETASAAETALWAVGLGVLAAFVLGVWGAFKLARDIARSHAGA